MPEAARTLDCPHFLLDAAGELMAEHGYGAMSMRQLAARVGLQPGSLYHHVTSKQDLLLDVLLNIHAQRLEAWRTCAFTRDLEGYLRFLLARQRSHPNEELVLRHEARHLNKTQRAWLDQALKRLQEPLRLFVKSCATRNSLEPPEDCNLHDAIISLLVTAENLRQCQELIDEKGVETWLLSTSQVLLRQALQPSAIPTWFEVTQGQPENEDSR
ncbi:helix-turn-helix domain containing protein [Pseudomonas sp. DCB_AW]|uniref:TetR/AcrR family transcriptional regulator n=1 Tax=Pseudomonas sp. DCB_AW TaxID=2993596 RepID=UPI0022488B47|nr:TetR/AcrR family transcriptional regulator [Pseudomonas sp. DCB_AW]MCX2684632.1 helix-turn-helix domain containing protein [Pseudomonas sp. DCB_AW]